MTDVPFAIGEEFASKWQFLPYIERGITQFVRIDACNVGGLTESMKVASLAEAHYIDLMPHNPLRAAIGVITRFSQIANYPAPSPAVKIHPDLTAPPTADSRSRRPKSGKAD